MSDRVLPGSGAKEPKRPTRLPKGKTPPRAKKNNNADNMTNGRATNKSGRRYGAYGGYEGVPYARARRLANGLIRDELRDIRPDIGAANRLYQRSLGDISHIFNESKDYIGSQNSLMEQQTANSRAAAQQLAQQLSQQLSGNAATAQGGVNSELDRLGISGSGMPAYFAADQANAQNVASIMGANADSNLALMGAGASQIGNLLLGANEGSRASAVGRSANVRDETVAQVRQAMRQVKGSRRDLMLQLLEQLAQTGWAQYMDQAQLNMQRRAMRGGGGGGYSSAGYGSSSGSSSSGSSSGNTYYGDMVDAQIDALTGGGKKKPGKKKKPIVTHADDYRTPLPPRTPIMPGFQY